MKHTVQLNNGMKSELTASFENLTTAYLFYEEQRYKMEWCDGHLVHGETGEVLAHFEICINDDGTVGYSKYISESGWWA